MISWTDKVFGVTEDTRAEAERRKTYVQVLDHLPAGGVVDDLRADGSHVKIYIQQPQAGSARRGVNSRKDEPRGGLAACSRTPRAVLRAAGQIRGCARRVHP